ncbi:fumarylacetoacetate hydrolase family protein [Novosphingobium sp. 1949]|uniref:Fumarylacetoacetate hydrolase family protein n=1 Tax=Novosphingobium organovorum TaxID=2930092 RepID=A0ABT0BGX9_9SPHN|nr:fumarylacetoacetate hydrolase family protein [Novosphingobium organovorum]MCJ2184284.1 fumarylacetoacetate hydrolase family protein [Novosphingobium organovorum]
MAPQDAPEGGPLAGGADAARGEAVAQAFVAARRAAQGLAAYPGTPPADMGAAYAIQDRAIVIDGRAVAGWKVGKINPPDDARLGTNRLAGPIFADTVHTLAPGEERAMPVFADGFGAAEAEFLLHVAPGWDGRVPATNAEVPALVDAVHIGIEIASSPYPAINADGPPVTASDFGNNHGLLIGPALGHGAHSDFDAIEVRLSIGGETVGCATSATMLDGPLGAVRFLLENLAARGIDCAQGTWVSTGAVTGVHPVSPGDRVEAEFAGHGTLRCRIEAAKGY